MEGGESAPTWEESEGAVPFSLSVKVDVIVLQYIWMMLGEVFTMLSIHVSTITMS